MRAGLIALMMMIGSQAGADEKCFAQPTLIRFYFEKAVHYFWPKANFNYPLHVVAEYKGPEEIKCLLNFYSDANLRDGSGNTALHYAAKSKRFDNVKFLLDVGADVNAYNYDKRVPLHDAAQYGASLKTVQLLLDSGVSVNSRIKWRNLTALNFAAGCTDCQPGVI